MSIGDKINYFGKVSEVIKFDKTHVVIKLESGTQLCTNKKTFKI
jgi:hypothetical protein